MEFYTRLSRRIREGQRYYLEEKSLSERFEALKVRTDELSDEDKAWIESVGDTYSVDTLEAKERAKGVIAIVKECESLLKVLKGSK